MAADIGNHSPIQSKTSHRKKCSPAIFEVARSRFRKNSGLRRGASRRRKGPNSCESGYSIKMLTTATQRVDQAVQVRFVVVRVRADSQISAAYAQHHAGLQTAATDLDRIPARQFESENAGPLSG